MASKSYGLDAESIARVSRATKASERRVQGGRPKDPEGLRVAKRAGAWGVTTSTITAKTSTAYGTGTANLEHAGMSKPTVVGNFPVYSRIPQTIATGKLVVVMWMDGKWMIVGQFCGTGT